MTQDQTPMDKEQEQPEPAPKPSLDEVWPVHPTARWPKGLSLKREDLY